MSPPSRGCWNKKIPKSMESPSANLPLERMTLSPGNWKKKIRGISFQQCSFNRTMGTIEAWKLGSMQIYRETLVDTPCNNYSTFTSPNTVRNNIFDRFESGCNPRISIDRSYQQILFNRATMGKQQQRRRCVSDVVTLSLATINIFSYIGMRA